MGFDLNSARQVTEREEQGTDVLVKDELGEQVTYKDGAGKEQPAVIVMAGANSKRYRKKKNEHDRRKVSNKTLIEGKFTTDVVELAATCVISWRGIEENGEPIEPNEFNAKRLFNLAPWVLDACVEAMNDPANFSQSSSPD